MSAAQDREAGAHKLFLRETHKHELTVLRDEGLYRHLRFQEPGSPFYWFDIVTWPGRLVICGDAGDWMFARIPDMFVFFAGERQAPGINPHYWSEKLLPGGRESAKVYDEDLFRAAVQEWYEEQAQRLHSDGERDALREAIDEQLLGKYVEHNHYEDGARRLLDDFEHVARNGLDWRTLTIDDAGEWDLRDFHRGFLWCCWAIVEGIQQYRATRVEVVADAV
jgi:hypothetical protein